MKYFMDLYIYTTVYHILLVMIFNLPQITDTSLECPHCDTPHPLEPHSPISSSVPLHDN